jgi:hypothetical protein
MLPFLLDSRNVPFAVAVAVLIGLFLVELIGALVGFSALGAGQGDSGLDLPESDVTLWSSAQAWMYFGKVPSVAWLAIFAGSFGVIGYVMQAATAMAFPTGAVAMGAGAASLVVTRGVSGWLHRHLFRDETTAVSADSLVGRVAVVTLGRGLPGAPTQAKVRDAHGTTHYILVEPEVATAALEPGAEIILLRREGPKFIAIGNSSEAILALDEPHRTETSTHS